MANRKHYAIVCDTNNRALKQRLWEYFRLNPSIFPSLRTKPETAVRTISIKTALKRLGWRIIELPTEVLIIKPDTNGNTDYAFSRNISM